MIYQTGDLIAGEHNLAYISKIDEIDEQEKDIEITWLFPKITKICYNNNDLQVILNIGYKHISVK
jgi:hypothetical protein